MSRDIWTWTEPSQKEVLAAPSHVCRGPAGPPCPCAWRGQGCQPQGRVLAQVTFPWRPFAESRGWRAAGTLADISGTRVYATLHYKQLFLVAVALWADPQDLGKRIYMTRPRVRSCMAGWGVLPGERNILLGLGSPRPARLLGSYSVLEGRGGRRTGPYEVV